MNIAVVTHRVGKGDGQGRVNYEIVREALRRGHRVTLVASEVAPDLSAEVERLPVPVRGYPTELWRNRVFADASGRILATARWDRILVNGAITHVQAHVNIVHFVHTTWLRSPLHTCRVRPGPYGWYQGLYTCLNAREERRVFQRDRLMVAVSQQVYDDLRSLEIPESRLRMIPNGVDIDEFSPGERSRGSLGLPEGKVLGLFAGDLRTPRKNLGRVLQATAEVADLHLLVVGALERSPFPAVARRLGIEDWVHFLGFRSDLADIMRASDMLIFPSRYETSGLVLLEAMASGLPVITARSVGGSDGVTPACGVVLADSEDLPGLVQAVQRLVHDSGLRSRMGQAARQVAEQHTWTSTVTRYLDLLEDEKGDR